MLLGNLNLLQEDDTAQNDDPFAMLDEGAAAGEGETGETGEGETGEEPDDAEIDAVEEAEKIEDPEETEEEVEVPEEAVEGVDEMSEEEIDEEISEAAEEAEEEIEAVEKAEDLMEEDVEESTERLELIHTLLSSVDDPNEIADQLTDDPSFVAMFGEDPALWLANVEDFLVAQENMELCHGVIAQELGLRLLTDEDVDKLNETNPGRAVAAMAYLNMADIYTDLDCSLEAASSIARRVGQVGSWTKDAVTGKLKLRGAAAVDGTGKKAQVLREMRGIKAITTGTAGGKKFARKEILQRFGYLKPGKVAGKLSLTNKGIAAIAVAAGSVVAVSAAGFATYALIRGKNLGANLKKLAAAKLNEGKLATASVNSLPSKADFSAAVKDCNAALTELDSACRKLPKPTSTDFTVPELGSVKESGPVGLRGWTSVNDINSAVQSLIAIHGRVLSLTETTVQKMKQAREEGGDKAALKAQFKLMKNSTGAVTDIACRLAKALVTLTRKIRA